MNAYTPVSNSALSMLAALATLTLAAGWWNRNTTLAWILCIAAVAAAEVVTQNEPAGFRMVALVFLLLLGMKGIVHTFEKERLPFLRYCSFAILWLGMRPRIFSLRGKLAWKRVFTDGTLCTLTGAALLIFFANGNVWIGIGALSLIIHFGLMTVSTAGWRLLGVPANRLFRNPFKATTLRNFWSRRWNLGYVEMISVAVYRPVRSHFGDKTALAAAFLFSGLLHEAAISLPVHSGYGLPTVYFGIQAALLGIEKHFALQSQIWVFAALILPLPLLFHTDFLNDIIKPAIP